MKIRDFIIIALLLALAGAYVSSELIKFHNNPALESGLIDSVCGADSKTGCDVVNESEASEIAGLPIALFGFMYYLGVILILISYFLSKEKSFLQTVFLMAGLGFIVDVFLLIYSIVILEAICKMCAITYIMTAGILILSYLAIKKQNISYFPDFTAVKTLRVSYLSFFSIGALLIIATGFLMNSISKVKEEINSNAESLLDKADPIELLDKSLKNYYKEYKKAMVFNINMADSPKKGGSKAVLNLTKFADFMCFGCRKKAEMLKETVNKMPNDISVTYKHYPLDTECNINMSRQLHPGACKLSYASFCAEKQNKFWDMHDLIYAQQDRWLNQAKKTGQGVSQEDLITLGKTIKLNMSVYNQCLKSDEPKKAVQNDIAEGKKLAIPGTPTVFVNGKKIDAPISFFLEQLVLAERNRR
ncbi:MAG: thioredoxin domain-containing protein [Spirochaetia bacterium]|nr:thioredoxin domain-containing protein [Spirochaetia bacterium]